MFYLFVFHLSLLIALLTCLCISNLWLHYADTKQRNPELTVWQLTGMTVRRFPASVAVALVANVFSFFVFALLGFHSMIVGLALTTQERLNQKYGHLGFSPYG